MKYPDAILSADWHLRNDQPVCRNDNFPESQWDVVDQVADLQKKYGCPLIIAGDLFHGWNPSAELITKTIEHMPAHDIVFAIYGQHDLPQHNFELRHKSGIATLEEAGCITVLKATNWGQKPKLSFNVGSHDLGHKGLRKRVCVWHTFIWDGVKLPWPGCEELTAEQALKKYNKFDLIVTGDHHKPFVYSYKKRLLVNPGCLTRQHADYADHKPRVYLWYADENRVKEVFLEVKENVITREHIIVQEARAKRLDSFIERLNFEYTVEGSVTSIVSLEDNLEKCIKNNHIRKDIVELLYKSIEL